MSRLFGHLLEHPARAYATLEPANVTCSEPTSWGSTARPERSPVIDLQPVCKGPRSCLKKAVLVAERLEPSTTESVLPETGIVRGPDNGESDWVGQTEDRYA
jgi:hypothetical protein